MEIKRPEYSGFSYPDIPLSDQDPGGRPEDGNNPFAIRLVRAFDPKDIGKGDRICAESITSVDETNERLVRSYHPSLSSKGVGVSESIFGEPVWLVDSPLQDSESVFAGGRPIHYYPDDYHEYIPRGILPPRFTHKYDAHFRHFINPRRFLRPTDLNSLRELFPNATGVEILVAGFMVIIFDTM